MDEKLDNKTTKKKRKNQHISDYRINIKSDENTTLTLNDILLSDEFKDFARKIILS